jgi:hypothetical protein
MANAQVSGLTRGAKRKADAKVHAKHNLADEIFRGAGGLLTRVQAEQQAGFMPVIQQRTRESTTSHGRNCMKTLMRSPSVAFSNRPAWICSMAIL